MRSEATTKHGVIAHTRRHHLAEQLRHVRAIEHEPGGRVEVDGHLRALVRLDAQLPSSEDAIKERDTRKRFWVLHDHHSHLWVQLAKREEDSVFGRACTSVAIDVFFEPTPKSLITFHEPWAPHCLRQRRQILPVDFLHLGLLL